MDVLLVFEKFGLPIAFLAVMIYLFMKLSSTCNHRDDKARDAHRDERREWKEGQEKLQDSTNSAIRDLTNAIIKIEISSK